MVGIVDCMSRVVGMEVTLAMLTVVGRKLESEEGESSSREPNSFSSFSSSSSLRGCCCCWPSCCVSCVRRCLPKTY